MKLHNILSLGLTSFLIFGCSTTSRTLKLKDGIGNTYTFKKEWISCNYDYGICEASTIKTNIRGQSYTIEMPVTDCNLYNLHDTILCSAALEFGLYWED